jgi:SAM-dependent methyltransferase
MAAGRFLVKSSGMDLALGFQIGGLIFTLILLCIITVLIIFWMAPMAVSLLGGGGPFVPSHFEEVERMMALAKIKPDDRVADLGSGDGRVILAAVRAGARHGTGYEIVPRLVAQARWQAKKEKLDGRAEFVRRSMWKADLHEVDVVFLYQIPYAMERLSKKFKTELRPGTRIVSNAFVLPGWEEKERDGNIRLYENLK